MKKIKNFKMSSLWEYQIPVVVVISIFLIICLILKKKIPSITMKYSADVIIGIFLGTIFFQFIPDGFSHLSESDSSILNHTGGIFLVIGFILNIFILKPIIKIVTVPDQSPLPLYNYSTPYVTNPINDTPYALSIPIHQYQKNTNNFSYRSPDPVSETMTIDPTLNYMWNSTNLHCYPVYSITQLETSLATTYPYLPQREDIILQNQQYSIPNYIQTHPKIMTNSTPPLGNLNLPDSNSDNTKSEVLCKSYNSFFILFILNIISSSTMLVSRKNAYDVLAISWAIGIHQLLHFVSLIMMSKHNTSSHVIEFASLQIFPVLSLTMIYLQQYYGGEVIWKDVVEHILTIISLILSGYCLFSCSIFFYLDMTRTIKHTVVFTMTLSLMYVLTNFHAYI